MANNETIADIIAEMRKTYVSKGGAGYCGEVWIDLLRYADRLEAAHKREIEEITYAYDPEKAAKSKAPDPVAYAIEGFKKDPAMMRMYRQSNSGDAAKLREALVKIEKMAHCDLCNVYPKYRDKFNDMIGGIEREARVALSAPPRNCDVGTAEEQAERFTKVCTANSKDGVRGLCSETCPFSRDYQGECALVWSQMPYEEGGIK